MSIISRILPAQASRLAQSQLSNVSMQMKRTARTTGQIRDLHLSPSKESYIPPATPNIPQLLEIAQSCFDNNNYIAAQKVYNFVLGVDANHKEARYMSNLCGKTIINGALPGF